MKGKIIFKKLLDFFCVNFDIASCSGMCNKEGQFSLQAHKIVALLSNLHVLLLNKES